MNFYNSRQKELQELINRMQSLGIETTMKNLKDLLTGESLQRLMRVEIDPTISALPERLRSRLQDEILTEAKNKYNDVIDTLPSKLRTMYDTLFEDDTHFSCCCQFICIINIYCIQLNGSAKISYSLSFAICFGCHS